MLKRAYVAAEDLARRARTWEKLLPGRERPAAPPRPRKAGLLVVDMQRFFLDSESPAHLPASSAVAPVVRGLVEGFRRAGRPVAFSVYVTDDDSPMGHRWRTPCRRGTATALGGGLAARPDEPLFLKSCCSVFREPALRAWCGERGVADLAVAGVMTNLCVESTVRDAFEEGLNVFVPLDGCAAADEESHVASLKAMALGFATVARADAIVSGLRETCP